MNGHLIRLASGHLRRKTNGHLVNAIAGTAPTITTPGLPASPEDTPYSFQMSATGGTTPYTWTGSGFPTGLSISTAGLISGTPTTPGTSTVSITCTGADSLATTRAFSLTIGPLLLNLCFELRQSNADYSLYFLVRDPADYEYFTPWVWYYPPETYPPASGLTDPLGTNGDYTNGITPNGGYTWRSSHPASYYVDQVAWQSGASPAGVYRFYWWHAGGNGSTSFRFRIYANGVQTPFWEYSNTISSELRNSYWSRVVTFNSVTGLVSQTP